MKRGALIVLGSAAVFLGLVGDGEACGRRKVLYVNQETGEKRIVEESVQVNGEYLRGPCAGKQVLYVDPVTRERLVVNEIVTEGRARSSRR